MKVIFIGVAVLIGAVLAATGLNNRAGASAMPEVRPSASALGLSPVAGVAHLTQQQALTAAQNAGWAVKIAEGKDLSFSYGSYNPHMRVRDSQGLVAVRPSNAWAITVGGLNDPASGPLLQPAGDRVVAPSTFHFLTVYIDDSTGQAIGARED